MHASSSSEPYRLFNIFHAAMKKYRPTDATTNPSLILQASEKPQYARLIDQAVQYAKSASKYVYNLRKFNDLTDKIQIYSVVLLTRNIALSVVLLVRRVNF